MRFENFEKTKKASTIGLFAVFGGFILLSAIALFVNPSLGEELASLEGKISMLLFAFFALMGLVVLILGFMVLFALEKQEKIARDLEEWKENRPKEDQGF